MNSVYHLLHSIEEPGQIPSWSNYLGEQMRENNQAYKETLNEKEVGLGRKPRQIIGARQWNSRIVNSNIISKWRCQGTQHGWNKSYLPNIHNCKSISDSYTDFNMLDIRWKMECCASGDKTNLVIINDPLIKMGQKKSSKFPSSNYYSL